ncbi:MAG: ATP phosphoribosyltransferase [Oscillospiraceae bacterium]|jgi:ATP phosphoribosyltransferase|nr:ATP phosphoribosyltransferase [Oscillospiraceae bacterium]
MSPSNPNSAFNELKEARLQRLEASFVLCKDLLTVTRCNPDTDREGFYVIPSSGSGVIGRYQTLRDMENEMPNIIVRTAVYKKLTAADRALKRKAGYETCQIIVTYGYRSPHIQRALYERIYAEEQQRQPNANEETLREAAHRKIACPEVAGHPTGGAVDVIIFDYGKGKFLDFGTDISELSDKNVYYAAEAIADEQRKHRTTLRAIMCEQGFVPYDGEWWHFSYGDREWAYYMYRRRLRNDGVEIPLVALYAQKDRNEISDIAFNDKCSLRNDDALPEEDTQVRVRLAVQKDGRLTEETLSILKRSGISITQDKRGFLARSGNFPLEVLFVRDDDIPSLVEAGVADLGIVGENEYWEKTGNPTLRDDASPHPKARKPKSVLKKHLGFGKCFLALAVPRDSDIKTLQDLHGKRIATSYRRLTEEFLREKGIKNCKIIDIAGSVEVAPLINYAHAIVDLVSTGSSLRQNNLEVFYNILNSETVLIANAGADGDPARRQIIDSLIERIECYLFAKNYKRVIMSVQKDRLEAVCAILGKKTGLFQSDDALRAEDAAAPPSPILIGTPVVLDVYGFDGWCSLQVIMEMSALWKTTEELKQNGVANIVFYDIEGIIKC